MNLHELIEAGWPVVPLRRGEKAPRPQQWTTTVFTAKDFAPEDNIGAKTGYPSPMGVLLDVDCDASEAVSAAADLLPPTLVHGRQGKPRSHYWYVHTGDVDPGSRLSYADLDGSVLIELRGRDHQTLIPPSTHPSGDMLRWENTEPMRAIAWAELESFVRLTAVAALLARHYPSEGSRHDAFLHLGGVLARFAVPAPLVRALVKTTARLAGDEGAADRERACLDSLSDTEAGRPTTGGPRFKELWPDGESLYTRLSSWFKKPSNSFVATMNDTHFVVPGTVQMLVATEGAPTEPLVLQTFGAFRDRYLNQYVTIQKGDATKTVSAGDAWLRAPERRTYRRLVFAPPHSPFPASAEDYNLWRGFAVPASADSPEVAQRHVARYLTHLHEVVCSDNDHAFHWLLDWMADIVQHPGRLSGKAVALRGKQGSGKSAAIEAFGALFGQHFLSVSSSEQIVGRFNAHLSGKVLVFADEALWGGDRRSAGAFRRLVTQNTLAIERKGVDIFNEPNYIRIAIASNEDWVAPAGFGERRLTVLQVDTVRPRAYFTKLFEEINAPGFSSALLKVLFSWPIDEARLAGGVATQALVDQIDQSSDVVTQWWAQCLEDGACTRMTGPAQEWPEWVADAELYEKFVEDMGHGAGHHYRGTRKAFLQKLRKLTGGELDHRYKRVRTSFADASVVTMRMAVRLPPLAEARRLFDTVIGFGRPWPEGAPSAPPALPVGEELQF